jgi:hypothetical protein
LPLQMPIMGLGKVDRWQSPWKEAQDGGQIMDRHLCAWKGDFTKIWIWDGFFTGMESVKWTESILA